MNSTGLIEELGLTESVETRLMAQAILCLSGPELTVVRLRRVSSKIEEEDELCRAVCGGGDGEGL